MTFLRGCLFDGSSLCSCAGGGAAACEVVAVLVFLLGVMEGEVEEEVWCSVLCDLSTSGCGLCAEPVPK